MAETSAATNGCSNGDDAGNVTPKPEEIDPEVKHLVCEWITDTLQHAWILPDAERKKTIKQLFLKWHPDKNMDDPKLALEATQHIQQEIERLENGLPRPRSRYSSSASSYGSSYTSRAREPFSATGDTYHRRYQTHFDDFLEEVRRKRADLNRQYEQQDRFARFQKEEREREREQQRREQDRRMREEQERADEVARERREELKREREELRRQRQRGYDLNTPKPTVNGDASPSGRGSRTPSRGTPSRETSGTTDGTSTEGRKARKATDTDTVTLSDEEMVEGLLKQSAHDIKAAQNDMGTDDPAYEWACFKAHQASEKAIKALHMFRIGLKSNSHELSTLAASMRDPELLELASKVQETIGSNNKLYNMALSDFTVIPHDDYTIEMALEAVTNAKDILERVKTLIH